MNQKFFKGSFIYHFIVVSYELVARLIFSLPRYSWLNSLKSIFLRMMGAKIGKRVVYYPGVWVAVAPNNTLEIGDDVDLALDVLVTCGGGVTIGDRTLIGYRTQILSSNHIVPPRPQRIFSSGHESQPVIIGKDVWIGANCIILPGVIIGEGAVVAAGSVVTRSIEPWHIVAGVPARTLRERS